MIQREEARHHFYICSVEWERVFLYIEIKTNYKHHTDFELCTFRSRTGEDDENVTLLEIRQSIPLKYTVTDEGNYRFEINMSAANGRQFLDNGKWILRAIREDGRKQICYVTTEVAYEFDSLSRIFRYGKSKYAYNVSFSTATKDEEHLWFFLHSFFMKENKDWKRRHYIGEAKTLRGKCNRLGMVTAIFLMNCFYKVVEKCYPKKGKNVLFMSETKDYLWGNLLFIDQRIKERGLDKEFRLSYSFRKAVGIHNSILSWMKTIWTLCKQDYVFVDDYTPLLGFLKLSKRTKLIQVWHAGEGFKAVGYCRFGKTGTPFPAGSSHKQYDYVLTGSKKLVKVFAEVFGIEEEAFLPVGMARLDNFLNEDYIAEFKKGFYAEHPELEHKKIILFAPTYRGAGQRSAYYDYNWLNLAEVYEMCGEEYIFMMKMHPFITEKIEIPKEYRDRIVEFSDFPNINDLYYVTDVLITDYSSNYFEYSLLKKPCVFFTPDRKLYEITRGVHRSVKLSAPGPVCDSFEEMMEVFKNKDFQVEKIEKFVEENFGEYDGHASDRVIDEILMK